MDVSWKRETIGKIGCWFYIYEYYTMDDLAMWESSIRRLRKLNSFNSFICENRRHMPTYKGRVGGVEES